MRLRQLFEAPKKTAAFAFGRLIPATSGHELLITHKEDFLRNKENYLKTMVGKLLIVLNQHITNHHHYVIHQRGYQ